MQLFHARMRVRWVTRAGREPDQHADPVPFRIAREQLAFNPGRDLFPFRLGPLPRRRRHRPFPRHLGDAKRKTSLQRSRRTQHIGGPGDEPIDHREETLQLALAVRARSDMRFGGSHFVRRQRLSGVRARYLALLAGVQARAWAHTPNTSDPSFWIGPRWWWRDQKDGPQPPVHKLTVSKYFLRVGRTCRRSARR